MAVLKVISKQLSVTAAAAEYGYSRQHLHRLIARYRADGLEAVEARSRRPLSNPQATEGKVRDFIVKTRLELTAAGWDAGPVTIAWHLEQAGLHVPSTSNERTCRPVARSQSTTLCLSPIASSLPSGDMAKGLGPRNGTCPVSIS